MYDLIEVREIATNRNGIIVVSNFAAVSGSKYRNETPGTAIVANINTPSVIRGSDVVSVDSHPLGSS